MKILTSFILLFISITSFTQSFENFITADGYKLMDGDQEYRFLSWNIPNLNYVEDLMDFDQTNPYALPTEFEMRDAFETIKEMGGRAIRIYTIPVKNASFPDEAVTFVEAPGDFNEEAFKVNDMMLALANEYQIRIIFSLLNNWQWMGGAPNYAAFRGKSRDDFWSDKQLIEDFKKTIDFTLNRKNTITGIKYKDDKAILCWETGNELYSTDSWTREIAAYIKGIDKKHLLMDGYHAIDATYVKEYSINDPNIDIISSHHYERNPLDMHRNIDKNLEIINGRKPYMLGEFGFISTSGYKSVIDKIIAEDQICGGLSWSIRYHHRNGGFYHHSEPFGSGLYKAYHWPGFPSGKKYDEKDFLEMYVEKAYEIQGKEVPTFAPPKAPTLLPIDEVHEIRWQGVAGASGYNVERSESAKGPWDVIAFNISDAKIENFANFHDKTADIGKSYFYRVSAIKSSGTSKPSNVVGPIKVKNQALVDNMENYGNMYHYHGIKPSTGDDRSFKEISSRLKGGYGAEVIYYAPGDFQDFSIYSFEGDPNWHLLLLSVSEDGENWESVPFEVTTYASPENNYGYGVPKKYFSTEDLGDNKYLKIKFYFQVQLVRAELIYK
ncbi:MAG: hypothetical protein JXR03_12615 [Cyclobacteriaceae bacterium]